MVLNFQLKKWNSWCSADEATRLKCVMGVAIHEFGHAMGFAHEHNRPDATCEIPTQGGNGNRLVGVWDLSSVMNYCNPSGVTTTILSETDKEGARIFYGPPEKAKVAAPGGSYLSSCNNVSATATTLYATCKDQGSSWWKTSLDYKTCIGNISNADGMLSCSRPAPAGSYLQTCHDAIVSNGLLTATCRARNGDSEKTQLDFGPCTSDIWNADGHLTCLKGKPPGGSYLQTCRDVIAQGTSVFATCRTIGGDWPHTMLSDVSVCVGDIGNDDGRLWCWNGRTAPGGSYGQSCKEVFLDADRLSARCKTRGGDWRTTLLAGVTDCVGDIGNNDGNLTCSKP
jgi:hypothetical protein